MTAALNEGVTADVFADSSHQLMTSQRDVERLGSQGALRVLQTRSRGNEEPESWPL